MRMMEIRLRVSEDRVTTLYDVVRGYCECVSIIPVEEKPRSKRHFANGVRNKGIRSDQLLVKLLTNSVSMSMSELRRAFKDHGFAESSVDPTISKNRHLVRHAAGQYFLAPQSSLALVTP